MAGLSDASLSRISIILNSPSPTITVNSGSICVGQTFTLTPNGVTTYTYSSGSAIVSPTTTASYSVTGTNTEGCLSSNIAVSTVTVNPLPTVTATSSTVNLCSDSTAILQGHGASTYTWSNSVVSTTIAITPTVTTTYSLVGTDIHGCTNTTTITQTVTSCSTTGIAKVTGNNYEINIHPNPNSGSFIIEPDNANQQIANIYDVSGKLVLSQLLTGKTIIDASNLNEGVYFLSILSTEGVVNRRLVIAK